MENSKMKLAKKEFDVKGTEQAQQIQPQTNPRDLEERVRRRAYELYEERGRVDGFEVENWLDAEAELLHAQHRAKAA
jgi:hypothetical protein